MLCESHALLKELPVPAGVLPQLLALEVPWLELGHFAQYSYGSGVKNTARCTREFLPHFQGLICSKNPIASQFAC